MTKKYIRPFIKILVLILCLYGCASTRQELIFNTMGRSDNRPPESNHIQQSYYNQIKPEDELLITDLHSEASILWPGTAKNVFKVNADSCVSLPLIGRVKVAGLDRQQASKIITKAYGESEFKTPNIDVQISNMRVTILGEVIRQGSYPILREDYELTDLLGDAQGFSVNANTEALKIFRGDRRHPTIISVNMNDYNFFVNPALVLKSGDLIYVAPRVSTLKLKNAQQYSGFAQLGLVLISTLFILINR